MKIRTKQKTNCIHLPGDIREKLLKLGALCVEPEHIVRKRNFDTPDRRLLHNDGWIRLQDEVGKITLSYKQLKKRSFTNKKELTVKIDSFETADAFFDVIGFESSTYQEMKKEGWRFGNVQIDLITWPWIPSFLEIEAPTKKDLKKTIDDLGLKIKDRFSGSVSVLYQYYYNVTEQEMDNLKEIRFGEVPEWMKERMKNGGRGQE